MILCNIAYEIVTPESAEEGEAADSGFIAEATPMTFRELVEWIRHGQPSCSPARGDINEWISQSEGETRAFFEDGEEETRSIHYARENPARKARYWRLAFQCAGISA